MRRIAAAVLVTGLLAGCGSDEDSPATSATAASTVTTTSSVAVGPGTTTTTAPDTTVTQPTPTVTPGPTTTTTPPTTSGVTRAAYIAEVDSLCRTINAQTKKLNTKANTAIRGAKTDQERLEALAPILKEGLGSQSLALETIEAVERPAADEATLKSYFALLEQQKRLLATLADAAAKADLATYRSVTAKSSALRQRARAKAVAFGFKECGSGKSDAA